jgi:peroxiredoxin
MIRRLAALCAALAATGAASATEIGTEAPDFVLKSVAGPNLRLSEHRGDVVMLAFLATWCGECRTQLEHLREVRARHADAGLKLLVVGLDPNARQLGELAERIGVRDAVLQDAKGDVGRLYDVERLPLLVLIDRFGVVRDVLEGYRRGNEAQYLERVQALLRE